MALFFVIVIIFFGSIAYGLKLDAYPRLVSIIDTLVADNGLDRDLLDYWLGEAKLDMTIVEIMERPAESLKWNEYKKRFLTRKSIQNGRKFLKENSEILSRAEIEFGIPQEIIVAIIGVETRYGMVTGRRRVLDSLTTLSVEYPRRSSYFSGELSEFLMLAHDGFFDPLEVKGSYAGAIGIPQFMPTSYRHYAIDFDGDGHANLIDSTEDAIGSVASYLKRHGWKTDEPIVKNFSKEDGETISVYVTKGFNPDISISSLINKGIQLEVEDFKDDKVGIIKLDNDYGSEFRIAYPNFFVLTRYNRSQNYAMSVFELSEKIAKP